MRRKQQDDKAETARRTALCEACLARGDRPGAGQALRRLGDRLGAGAAGWLNPYYIDECAGLVQPWREEVCCACPSRAAHGIV